MAMIRVVQQDATTHNSKKEFKVAYQIASVYEKKKIHPTIQPKTC